MKLLILLALFSASLVYATKENFQVSGPADTLRKCLLKGLCSTTLGCCSGHGVCTWNGTLTVDPYCVCGTGLGCSSYTYTGTTCNVINMGTFNSSDGCCAGVTYDRVFNADGTCNQRSATYPDPEKGAQGRLMLRVTAAGNYADGLSTPQSIDIDAVVANLTSANRSITQSRFNMLSVAILEVAQEDLVSFERSTTDNFTVDNKTYAKYKPNANTGAIWTGTTLNATNQSVPNQYSNAASAWIDYGPLYDYVTRNYDSSNGRTLAYIDNSDSSSVVAHWQSLDYSPEFIAVVQLGGEYHNLMVRTYDDFYCGHHNLTNDIDHSNCTNWYGNAQGHLDYLYGESRKATIRFWQTLIQVVGLSIFGAGGTSNEPFFDAWFRRDVKRWNEFGGDNTNAQATGTSVRAKSEFDTQTVRVTNDIGRVQLVSGVDWLLSMREPVNLTASSRLGDQDCENIPVTSVANKILRLAQTKSRVFGSRIDPSYSTQLKVALTRMRELGLESYNGHLAKLSSSGLAGATPDTDVYSGMMNENRLSTHILQSSWDSFNIMTPKLLMAIYAPISDSIMMDRYSAFAVNPTTHATSAGDFFPDPKFQPVLTWDPIQSHCWVDPATGDCNAAAYEAFYLIGGDHPMADYLGNGDSGPSNFNIMGPRFKSNGEGPANAYQMHNLLMGALFYHGDDNSIPVYQNDLTVFLDNGVADCVSMYITRSSTNFDGKCCDIARRCRWSTPDSTHGC